MESKFCKGERANGPTGKAQNRKVKGIKEKLPGCPVSPRAGYPGGRRQGWGCSELQVNEERAHSAAVTIDFSFQAACKLPQESMLEGENKFLKLAWSILQEKPFA